MLFWILHETNFRHSLRRELNKIDFYGELLSGLDSTRKYDCNDRFVIDNILSGRTYYRKSFLNRTLADLSFYLTILGSGSSGFAYHNGLPVLGDHLSELINRSALQVLNGPDEIDFPLRISILDSAYGEYNRIHSIEPTRVFVRKGTYAETADFRSQLLVDQITSGQNVLLIGLVTQIARDMLARGLKVSISDMSPDLVDTAVYGIPVVTQGNKWTLERLAISDAAIVTGSVFSTNTLDSIFEVAQLNGVDLFFYLETGSNFAPYLIERGAKFVVAEKFPFYDLPGETRFEVHQPD